MKKYSRLLSPVERYFLAINANHKFMVECVVEGHGHVDADLLQSALNICGEANPGSRVRLSGVLGFTRWVDSGIAPKVRQIESTQWDGFSEAGAYFLQHTLLPEKGEPACEVILVLGSPVRIIFRAVHAAMDGRALHHWCTEVFKAMRNEPLLGSPSTLIDLDVMERYRDRVKHEPVKRDCIAFSSVQEPSNASELEYSWRRIELKKNHRNLLFKFAIFFSKYARKHQSGEVAWTIPIDFRDKRVSESELSTANLTGYLVIPVEPEDGPRHIARKIKTELDDYRDCVLTPGIHIINWIPLALLKWQIRMGIKELYKTSEYLPTGGISSAGGSVDLTQFSFAGFNISKVFPVAATVGKMNIVYLNQGEGAQVVITVPRAYNAQGQLDSLIDAFSQEFSAPA